jgi:MFS family permease
MNEPDHFASVQDRRNAISAGRRIGEDDSAFMRVVPLQLFTRENRFNTLVGLMFGLGSLLAIWTTNIWLPTILSLMVQKGGISGADAVPFVSHGIMVWSFGGIFGYAAFGWIADWVGRRSAIAFYSIGSVVFGLILYLALPTYEPWYPIVLPVFGFFVFGVFSGHAVYFPELFPTHIRSTGVAFCNGTGRIITSFGPLVAGLLVGAFNGSFNNVTAFMSCFALLSVIAMIIGRETGNDELPR